MILHMIKFVYSFSTTDQATCISNQLFVNCQ